MTRLHKAKRVAADLLSAEGRRSLLSRAVDRLDGRLTPALTRSHLLPRDLVDVRLQLALPTGPVSGPLRIGWVITPPMAGSGGHTTAFRMVQALERAGHKCQLLLYDTFGGDIAEQERIIRTSWPKLQAGVSSVNDGFQNLDACVATGWQTAHALAARTSAIPLHRFYFVQDYEPFFYPHGYDYALAEQTYLFGFHNIALGSMVSKHMSDLSVPHSVVPFGCDIETYHLLDPKKRSGVVFYSRAGTSRRGFLLATMGLSQFHHRRPEVPIWVFGPLSRVEFDFPIAWQGLLTPAGLNELYNSAVCGLGMSFTNISLVAGEMLAAGCVPIVNDSQDGRLDMPSPFVSWVPPTPAGVADALVRLIDEPPSDFMTIAQSAPASWSETEQRFVKIVEAEVQGA